MTTRQRTFRMSDEDWQRLTERCRHLVPADRKPPTARADSAWQVWELLRMIANGEVELDATGQHRPR